MFNKAAICYLLLSLMICTLIVPADNAFAGEGESITDLAAKVRKLDLGEESFYIGAYLTDGVCGG